MSKISIGDIISPGSLISIRSVKDPSWSLNIVYHCGGDIMDIPLTQDIMKCCLFIDSKITIKFKNEQYEYLLQGSVCDIELNGLPYIRVKILEYDRNTNNRLFPRRDVRLPANLSVSESTTYFCMVSNISLGGISFIINKDIPSNTECEINIHLNDSNCIYAKGIIIKGHNERRLYEFRMQFTYMNEEHSTILHNCMHDIENSYDVLRKKYLIPAEVLYL